MCNTCGVFFVIVQRHVQFTKDHWLRSVKVAHVPQVREVLSSMHAGSHEVRKHGGIILLQNRKEKIIGIHNKPILITFILSTIKNVEFEFQMYVLGRHIWYRKGPYMQRALVTLNTR